jgi:hypothetical protein
MDHETRAHCQFGNVFGVIMNNRSVKWRAAAVAAFAVLASSGAASAAGTDIFSSLYAFQGGSDGANPHATLLQAAGGSLYGVTTAAGAGSGTFFSLTPPASTGGAWSEAALLSFVADGTEPSGDLAPFKTGFIGTKIGDGVPGSLYQLKLTATVPSVWKEQTIHSFGAAGDGWNPDNGLTKLAPAYYGVTEAGGLAGCKSRTATAAADGCGTVFKTIPPIKPGVPWTESVLYTFTGSADGDAPQADLLKYNGAFYGTTTLGGTGGCAIAGTTGGCGTFFEISPQGVKTVLHQFQGGNDGAVPFGKLVHVGAVFYGVTIYGGGTGCGGQGCGTVYRLKPPATPGGPWIEKVMYAFQGGSDGAIPHGGVVAYHGDLYGTTSYGGGAGCGGDGCGTVFKIAPLTPGTDVIVHAFQGSDGAYPTATFLHTTSGLIGITEFGGNAPCSGGKVLAGFPGCGTVFQVQ